MAYAFMLLRDIERLSDALKRLNVCPLGSGALAGTTFPIDRDFTARKLGFDSACLNSLNGVSDRDFCVELASALAMLMTHLSRFSEEIILWSSWEFRFVELDDAFSTGSSIMTKKKNPDIAELTRGKSARVYGNLMTLLSMLKSLPLAYNKDMQEDKEGAFDAMDTACSCLDLYEGMLRSMKFNNEIMEKSAAGGFTNATDAADYLVGKGMPFRDAHSVVGRMVLECIDKGITIDEMSIEDLKKLSPIIEEDFYQAVSIETCVLKRSTQGAPGPDAMTEEIKNCEKFISETKALVDPLDDFLN
jgi:argininosuccinate lyase